MCLALPGLEFTKEAIRRGNTVIATARAESSLDNARSAGARSAQWDQAVPLEQLQKQAEGTASPRSQPQWPALTYMFGPHSHHRGKRIY